MKKILLFLIIAPSLLLPFSVLAQSIDCSAYGVGYVYNGTTCVSSSAPQNPPTTSITVTKDPGTGGNGTGNTAQDTNCPNGGRLNAQGSCDLGYTPLEPIAGITTGANGSQLDFPHLLGNIYKIAITIGALFSVLMLTISGVRYMLSDIVTDKQKAKKRITACLYGLVLIAASWLILNTINPQLVKFNLTPPSVNGIVSPVSNGNNSNQVVQTVPAASVQAPQGSTQVLNPLQYNSQDSSNADVAKASSDFMKQCQQNQGSVILVPGSSPGQTAETCISAPGLY